MLTCLIETENRYTQNKLALTSASLISVSAHTKQTCTNFDSESIHTHKTGYHRLFFSWEPFTLVTFRALKETEWTVLQIPQFLYVIGNTSQKVTSLGLQDWFFLKIKSIIVNCIGDTSFWSANWPFSNSDNISFFNGQESAKGSV